MQLADMITPAGIRQDFPIHTKRKHLGWSRKAVKGLTYILTDRGPMKRWLRVIGRAQEQACRCGEPQNATHLRRCLLIQDGRGRPRSIEESMEDREWCEEVVNFLTT